MPKITALELLKNVLSAPASVLIFTFLGTLATLEHRGNNEFLGLFTKSIISSELLTLLLGLSISSAFISYSHLKYGYTQKAFNDYFLVSKMTAMMFLGAFNAQAIHLLDKHQPDQLLLIILANIYFILLFSVPLQANRLWLNYLIHNDNSPAIARSFTGFIMIATVSDMNIIF